MGIGGCFSTVRSVGIHVKKRKRNDQRPICRCKAYKFPHKIGGKCKGITFATFYFYNVKQLCNECNCLSNNNCDVVDGLESIKEAECFRYQEHYCPAENLPLDFKDQE